MENKIFINITLTKKQFFGIVFILITLIAIVITAYLVQQRQIYRSNASEVHDAFEITKVEEDGTEKKVDCTDNYCTTDSLELNFKVIDLEKLDKLIQ